MNKDTGNKEPVKVPAFEGESGWQCPDCDHIHPEEPANPAYECGTCGNTWSRANAPNDRPHQCECGKFAAKLHESACEQCDSVEELEGVEAADCTECGETVTDDDWEQHWIHEHGAEPEPEPEPAKPLLTSAGDLQVIEASRPYEVIWEEPAEETDAERTERWMQDLERKQKKATAAYEQSEAWRKEQEEERKR